MVRAASMLLNFGRNRLIGIVLGLLLGVQAAAPARPIATVPPVRLLPAAVRRPVAYETIGGLAVFRLRIAGRDAWALLDNRAERSFVDLAFARNAGLTIDPRTSARVTAGSNLAGQRVERVPIAVAGQFAATVPTMIGIDLAPISRSLGRPIALVVGADFYRRFAVATQAGVLRFLPSGSVRVAAAPVALLDARPRVTILLGGQRFVATVDTGLSGALILTPQAWARLGTPDAACERERLRTGDGNARTGRSCVGPAVRVGPITRPSTRVSVSELAAANGDGLIGMGLLGTTDGLIVDVSARKLWVVPAGQAAAETTGTLDG